MDNGNNKQQSGNHDPDENSHQDEVPAWLQGIDPPDLDDTSPNEPINDDEDIWVKEASQDYSETTQEETGPEDSPTPNKSLPDWLSQLSNIDNETPKDKDLPEDAFNETPEEIIMTDDVANESETTDELEVNADIQMDTNDIQDSPIQDSTEDEGYIEISEFDLAEVPEPPPASEEEDISEDEELPSWLDEMIAEPADDLIEDDTVIETQLDEEEGEEGEQEEEQIIPFDVYLKAPHFEDEGIDLPWEQNLITADLPDETIHNDSTFSIIEGDTQPVTTQSETINSSETAQEIQESNQEQPEELPKTLMFAKHLLDQSEFKPARKILDTYIDQSKFVEEINQWLQAIVNKTTEANSDVWELIGDIALLTNDPEQALTAYSQAITLLVSGKKDINESD